MSRSDFKKIRFRLLRPLSLLLLVAAIFVVLLLLYSRTGHFKQQLASIIAEQLEAALDRRIMIEGAALNFVGPEIRLNGLSISDAGGGFTRPFFRAEACRIRLDAFSLLKLRLEIARIILLRPEFRIRFDEKGRIILPALKTDEKAEEGDLTASIRSVKLEDGFIHINHRQVPFELQMEHFRFLMRRDLMDNDFTGQMAFSGGFMQYQSYARVPIQKVELQFGIESDRLDITEAMVQVPGVTAGIRGWLQLHTPVAYHFDADMKASAETVRETLEMQKPLSGTISFQGRIEGSGSDVRVTGNCSGEDIVLDRFHADGLNGTLQWERGGLHFSDIQCTAMGGEIDGSFSAESTGSQTVMHTAFNFRAIDLESLANDLDIQGMRVAGRATGHGEFGWEKEKLIDGTGNLTLKIKPPGKRPGDTDGSIPLDADLSCALQGQKMQFLKSRLSFGGMNILIDGTMGLDKAAELDIEANTDSLAEADRLIKQIRQMLSKEKKESVELFGMNGRGEFTGKLTGPVDNPLVRGAFNGQEIMYAGRSIGNAQGNLSFHDGYLNISDTHLILPEGALDLEGTFRIFKTAGAAQPDIKAVLGFENYALGTLAHLFKRGLPAEGRISGTIRIEGSYDMPEGEAFFTVKDGSLAKIPFKNLEAGVLIAPPQIKLTELRLEAADGSLAASGVLDSREGTMDFTCHGKGLDLASVPFLKSRQCEGIASFSLSVQGHPENPDIRIDPLEIEAFSIAETPLPNLEGTAELNSTSGRFQIKYEDGTLICRGSFIPRGNFPVEGEISFLNADFSPLLKVFTGFSEIEEKLSGEMQFRLSALEPETFESTLRLDKLSTSFSGYRIENVEPVRLSLTNRKLFLRDASFAGENSLFSIAGSVDLTEKQRLDLQIDGNINLVLARFFMPDLTTRGRLSLAAELTGSIQNPVFSGAAEINEGYLSIPDFPLPLKNITARLKLATRGIQLVSCRSEFGTGTLDCSGDIILTQSDRPAFALDFRAENVRMKYPEGVSSLFGADCYLRGYGEDMILSGKVMVKNVLYSTNITREWIQERQRSKDMIAGTANHVKNRLKLNLDIQADDALFIKNNLADVEMSGDLSLRGTLAEPILFGHAEVLRGNIYFQNTRYQIEKGIIDFQNPTHINPVIDVTGTATIGQYDIELNVQGPLDNIHFNYASTPPLSDPDILTLLTTGRVSEGREKARDFAAVGATSFLTDQVLSGFASESGKIFGFDRFSIDPRFSEEQNAPTVWITVGKQITRDLQVTYSTNITSARENTVMAEYHLSHSFILVGTKDEYSSGGFLIIYRLSY